MQRKTNFCLNVTVTVSSQHSDDNRDQNRQFLKQPSSHYLTRNLNAQPFASHSNSQQINAVIVVLSTQVPSLGHVPPARQERIRRRSLDGSNQGAFGSRVGGSGVLGGAPCGRPRMHTREVGARRRGGRPPGGARRGGASRRRRDLGGGRRPRTFGCVSVSNEPELHHTGEISIFRTQFACLALSNKGSELPNVSKQGCFSIFLSF